MSPINQMFHDFVGIFDRLCIPYAIMGGVAVRAHGIPRPTYDIDFTVLIERNDLTILFSEIDKSGYDIPEHYQTGWVDKVAGMPLVKATTVAENRALVADLFLAETEFQKSLIDRRIKDRVNDLEVSIVTPEDLILLKLLAARPRDIGDIEDVLTMHLKLDEVYLRKWADILNIRDNLEKALRRGS